MTCEDCRNRPICVISELLRMIDDTMTIPEEITLGVVKCKLQRPFTKKQKQAMEKLEVDSSNPDEVLTEPETKIKPSLNCPMCNYKVIFETLPSQRTPVLCPKCKNKFEV